MSQNEYTISQREFTMSQREFNQDSDIIDFFNKIEKGYFLDIGAYDGETFSNTYLLLSEIYI